MLCSDVPLSCYCCCYHNQEQQPAKRARLEQSRPIAEIDVKAQPAEPVFEVQPLTPIDVATLMQDVCQAATFKM